MNDRAFSLILSLIAGLAIGSHLGCSTYRIPREISLWNPRRSFCPECKMSLGWLQTIPILSWFLLRGRCKNCGARISFKYPLIEAVTALFFALATLRFGFPLALPIWFLLAMLIGSTWIDLEFLIIPDRYTKPSIVLGFIASLIFPQLQSTDSRLDAALASVIGILTGGGLLYLISELGKLVFGQYKITLPDPVGFTFEGNPADDPQIVIDGESFHWADHFFRRKDKIIIQAIGLQINGRSEKNSQITFFHDRLVIGQAIIPLTDIHEMKGQTRSAVFPREAMGLGDVKLLAAIGAYTGWPGALFTIPAASLFGAILGLLTLLMKRRDLSTKIPFGPYLAAGAVIWLFFGEEILDWYRSLAGL